MARYRLKLASWIVVRDAEPLPKKFQSPEQSADFAKEIVAAYDDDKERMWLVLLDTKNQYRMHHEVSVGNQNMSLVHPREVFGPALREGACAILIFHNHPSGDPTPSRDDRELTTRLKNCGELVGIRLLDHLIMGNGTGTWVSMQNVGLL